MNNSNRFNSNAKQAVLPMLIQDYLDICDPVLTFDRFMGGIDLEKYLKNIRKHYTGRFRYDPVSMLKTVLFGFMTNGYISLRELEDQCRVNLRFMYLMGNEVPSYPDDMAKICADGSPSYAAETGFGYIHIKEILDLLKEQKYPGNVIVELYDYSPEHMLEGIGESVSWVAGVLRE